MCRFGRRLAQPLPDSGIRFDVGNDFFVGTSCHKVCRIKIRILVKKQPVHINIYLFELLIHSLRYGLYLEQIMRGGPCLVGRIGRSKLAQHQFRYCWRIQVRFKKGNFSFSTNPFAHESASPNNSIYPCTNSPGGPGRIFPR